MVMTMDQMKTLIFLAVHRTNAAVTCRSSAPLVTKCKGRWIFSFCELW